MGVEVDAGRARARPRVRRVRRAGGPGGAATTRPPAPRPAAGSKVRSECARTSSVEPQHRGPRGVRVVVGHRSPRLVGAQHVPRRDEGQPRSQAEALVDHPDEGPQRRPPLAPVVARPRLGLEAPEGDGVEVARTVATQTGDSPTAGDRGHRAPGSPAGRRPSQPLTTAGPDARILVAQGHLGQGVGCPTSRHRHSRCCHGCPARPDASRTGRAAAVPRDLPPDDAGRRARRSRTRSSRTRSGSSGGTWCSPTSTWRRSTPTSRAVADVPRPWRLAFDAPAALPAAAARAARHQRAHQLRPAAGAAGGDQRRGVRRPGVAGPPARATTSGSTACCPAGSPPRTTSWPRCRRGSLLDRVLQPLNRLAPSGSCARRGRRSGTTPSSSSSARLAGAGRVCRAAGRARGAQRRPDRRPAGARAGAAAAGRGRVRRGPAAASRGLSGLEGRWG